MEDGTRKLKHPLTQWSFSSYCGLVVILGVRPLRFLFLKDIDLSERMKINAVAILLWLSPLVCSQMIEVPLVHMPSLLLIVV